MGVKPAAGSPRGYVQFAGEPACLSRCFAARSGVPAKPGGRETQPLVTPMKKQFLISVVVLFVASMAFDFVVHGVLLKAAYDAQPALMRKEADAQRHFPAMLLAHALIAVSVTAIYRRGRETDKPWLGQGVRFGVWFALAACVPGFLIYYAVQPVGLSVAVKQVCFGGLATVLLGVVAAALNKASA